jgi:23S rRNA pseudouridine1911/1915/1917 synthase
MIVARDDEAHRRLAAMIKAREVERTYLALVEGHLRSRTGTIDAPLGRDHRAPERRAVRGRGSRDARTHFSVVETLAAESLVEARLETGRTHQIRAHFAAIGHPVVADERYGGHRRHGLGRQFLHSARLGFEHPFSGDALRFSSELPDDLAEALSSARAGG